MSKLYEFKIIADTIMKDIEVDSRLKEKVMIKIKPQIFKRIRYVLPAASTFLVVVISGLLVYQGFFVNDKIDKDGPMINKDGPMINKDGEQHMSVSPLKPGGTMEEAKEYMGDSLIIPDYIPEGFELADIYMPNGESFKDEGIMLKYSSKDDEFRIFQRLRPIPYNHMDNFREINIKGVNGLISYFDPDSAEKEDVDDKPLLPDKLPVDNEAFNPEDDNAQIPPPLPESDPLINEQVSECESEIVFPAGTCKGYVELVWTINNRQYIINGTISEDEAIKIASSMIS